MGTIDFVLAASAGIASLLAPGLAAPAALAQDWPTRPMTMVAPFAAGGSTDAIARIVADGLSSQLHQPVIVENPLPCAARGSKLHHQKPGRARNGTLPELW